MLSVLKNAHEAWPLLLIIELWINLIKMEWQYTNRNKFILFTLSNLPKENGNIKNLDINNTNIS